MPDSLARFYLPDDDSDHKDEREACLETLLSSWEQYGSRPEQTENIWVQDLCDYLDLLASNRVKHVQEWLEANTLRFKTDQAEFETLRRKFDKLSVSIKGSVHLCRLQCSDCQLLCLQAHHHDGAHKCRTSHLCHKSCEYIDEHLGVEEPCGLP